MQKKNRRLMAWRPAGKGPAGSVGGAGFSLSRPGAHSASLGLDFCCRRLKAWRRWRSRSIRPHKLFAPCPANGAVGEVGTTPSLDRLALPLLLLCRRGGRGALVTAILSTFVFKRRARHWHTLYYVIVGADCALLW
ncbi:hypothetical protein GQ53DRAFT_244657 [Thozetella sp. PMI_491]|nr:hypothetical protein GQ53DRAFT_244657 [Thozetella sp. PMI_491]